MSAQSKSSTTGDREARDFTKNISSAPVDLTEENRKYGFQFLAAGIASSVAPWILTFVLNFVSSRVNALLMVFGLSFVVAGIGIIVSPPKSRLDADENKPRNGLLILVGLLLGLVEAYFFNKALGLW